MKKKWLDIGVLSGLLLLAVAYLLLAQRFPESGHIGPAYFPRALAIVLIVLCGVQFILALRVKSEERFEIKFLSKILFALGVVCAYFAAWQYLHFFYGSTFLATLALLLGFAPKEERWKPKQLIVRIAISGIFTLFVYLFFGLFMSIRF